MKTDDEWVSAYLDGELSDEEIRVLDTRFKVDQTLRKLLDEYRNQQDLLRLGADEINRDAVPESIMSLLAEPTVFPWLDRLKNLSISLFDLRYLTVTGGTCVFLMGILIAIFFSKGPQTLSEPMQAFLSQMEFRIDVLGGQEQRIELRLSYLSKSGNLCKLYEARSSEETYLNVACLKQSNWQLVFEHKLDYSPIRRDLYVPARAQLAPEVEAFILSDIDGNPLSLEQEKSFLKLK